jgi:hypothetical protein
MKKLDDVLRIQKKEYDNDQKIPTNSYIDVFWKWQVIYSSKKKIFEKGKVEQAQ